MAKPGSKVDAPPERLQIAAELTMYYAQLLTEWSRVDLFDSRISPGVWAGLRAYANGRNRADYERWEKGPGKRRQQQKQDEKLRQRYAGRERE